MQTETQMPALRAAARRSRGLRAPQPCEELEEKRQSQMQSWLLKPGLIYQPT